MIVYLIQNLIVIINYLITKGNDGNPIVCCNPDGSTPDILPQDCLQITIPKDENGYSKKRCLSSQRASDTADLGCHIKPVRQVITVHPLISSMSLFRL